MDAVEEVKSRLNIEDVIGEYVQLKRAGRNFRGLSPFSSEKSPSFMVSPEKQIWHDFSSGKGGNMFSFVMEMEGLDFRGALELLARKAGIDLEQFRTGRSSGNGQQKERLYQALALATKFYQVQFSKQPAALKYILQTRQCSKQTALEWQIGYAPTSGTAVVDFLRSQKFSDDEIKRAGLSSQRYRTVNDMFRGRIMIPLADAQGRVIGFTARLLEDNPNAPKYINTPQTPLYDKSRHVFGLHLAKEAIRKSHMAVLVEGNLDVIASHQAGVRQVVATAGTALTEPHLKALSRFTNDIRLSFDADKAGLAATERAIPIASKVGVTLGIITIPSGKDPDELIRQDKTIWEQIIQQPQPALDWLMERYTAALDITTAPGKRQFSDVLLPIVQALTDSVERDHYLNALASRLQVSREALVTKLDSKAPDKPRLKQPRVTLTAEHPAKIEAIKTQDHFLSLLLVQPELRDALQPLNQTMFIQPLSQELFGFLQAHPDFSVKQPAELLQNLREYGNILVVQYEELYQGLELTELRFEATRLQVRLIEQYVKNQKNRLREQMPTADEAQLQTLLEHAKQLDDLLKQVSRKM